MTDEQKYWRRDQTSSVTPPDLDKRVDYADHIVRARGKRTRYTSVSTSNTRIDRFGPQLYELLREKLGADGHALIEHGRLLSALRERARAAEKAERQKAVQALRYALKNCEGLVDWHFDLTGVEPKHRFVWTADKIRPYFARR